MKDKIFKFIFSKHYFFGYPDETTLNQLVECKNILLSSKKHEIRF